MPSNTTFNIKKFLNFPYITINSNPVNLAGFGIES